MKKPIPLSFIPVFFLALFLAWGCASTHKTFQEKRPDVVANFLSMQPNKALAIFMTSDNRYGYGYGNRYDTIETARERALQECQARQQEYENLAEVCRIYMVNNKRINQ